MARRSVRYICLPAKKEAEKAKVLLCFLLLNLLCISTTLNFDIAFFSPFFRRNAGQIIAFCRDFR